MSFPMRYPTLMSTSNSSSRTLAAKRQKTRPRGLPEMDSGEALAGPANGPQIPQGLEGVRKLPIPIIRFLLPPRGGAQIFGV